ncbi:MBL fold metallo-hydrolase [Roseomonas ludipueritiae]|uniref:MBL fold metallo-hydrolase n=1 Tax=Pseudoroseomonas ludipueritiae TaxID=198093 RepID=A0ABR7RDS0_9PROT|nr:MBL fold metallo-hydrolase [Pseudoroseomonas ludipueritiae]
MAASGRATRCGVRILAQQVPLDRSDLTGEQQDDGIIQVLDDLAYKQLVFVNVVFFGQAGQRHWVLVDAGIPASAGRIRRAAAARFGEGVPPAAIIMTHGHFDHVGVLEELAAEWNVPVYAHPLERPYLDGSRAYPPADPTVGGGAMALLSPLYPRSPVNVGQWLRDLPADGSVPEMPGWRWLHTPGHSVGHISLWREADRTLVAGDAIITTAGESAYATAVQEPELHGPPKYFTHDWQAAEASVAELAALEPELVVAGHGMAMRGEAMRAALHRLSREFRQLAVPPHGRFVDAPRRAEDGSAYVKP